MTVPLKRNFGPVLAITTYNDFDEAIDAANDTNAGLSSYIFSENLKEVMEATERLKFGEVYAIAKQKKLLMVTMLVGENQV